MRVKVTGRGSIQCALCRTILISWQRMDWDTADLTTAASEHDETCKGETP